MGKVCVEVGEDALDGAPRADDVDATSSVLYPGFSEVEQDATAEDGMHHPHRPTGMSPGWLVRVGLSICGI